jgi:hypothetical protein
MGGDPNMHHGGSRNCEVSHNGSHFLRAPAHETPIPMRRPPRCSSAGLAGVTQHRGVTAAFIIS